MTYRWFDHIASSLNVRNVMQSVLRYNVASDADCVAQIEAKEMNRNPVLRDIDAALIICDGRPSGWVPVNLGRVYLKLRDGQPVYTISFDRSIREIALSLDGGSFIAASTTLLDAIGAFSKSDRPATFFVIDDTDVVGSLSYDRLKRSFAFRTCMLALVLGLEEQALSLLMFDPEASLKLLPGGRKEKLWARLEQDDEFRICLTEITPDTCLDGLEGLLSSEAQVGWYYLITPALHESFIGPYGSEEEALTQAEIASSDDDYLGEIDTLKRIRALRWSQFADRKEMIARRAKQGDLGSHWDSKRTAKVMESAHRLRNYCAHPGSEEEPEFLHVPTSFTDVLREVTELTRCIGDRIDEIEGTEHKPELSVISPGTLS